MNPISQVKENILTPFVFTPGEDIDEYSDDGIQIEFEHLCRNSCKEIAKCNLTKNIGKLPINVKKNKFIQIVPFDQIRIKLQKTDLDSDYINASYIPSIHDPTSTEFIVSQDPSDETITEFWLMIWEQNVSIILNLSKKLCKSYWLNTLDVDEKINVNCDFSLEIVDKEEHNLYTERNLLLENKITKEKRNIVHLHMDVWYAASSPDFQGFERLLEYFKSLQLVPPYLIHSSAGIGRCGTFITIYRIMERISNGQKWINIADEVFEIRKYRDFMVQSKAQYIFIHDFIHEILRRRRDSFYKWDSSSNRYEYHL